MPRFFLDNIGGDAAVIYGEDARHIAKSLRMREGEGVILCDMRGSDYHCEIERVATDAVHVRVLDKTPSIGETACRIRLYQALPKGDKLDFILQKATELGVSEIVPVVTDRCISRPNASDMEKKTKRLQKIVYEAAKQSQRGIIPKILPLQVFDAAVEGMSRADIGILFYEGSTRPLRDALSGEPKTISVMIGSEGGFSSREASLAEASGIQVVSLGSRILRCETAPVCALSAILYFLCEF